MSDQQLAAELFLFTFAIVYSDCVVTSGDGVGDGVGDGAGSVGVGDGVGEAFAAGVAETFGAGVSAGAGAAPRTTSPWISFSPTARVIAAFALDVATN